LAKGSHVEIHGELRSRTYAGKDNVPPRMVMSFTSARSAV